MEKPLGRRVPSDFTHISKYPYSAVAPQTVTTVNRTLELPAWHWKHNQGSEGACVGFAASMMMAITNEQQARSAKTPPYVHLYNSRWLWNEAKRVDEWDDTNPGDDNGTSVRAACDVLRTIGHVRIKRRIEQPAALDQGIKTNRWARTIDEIRTSIANGLPVTIGVNWYSSFDQPEQEFMNRWYIGQEDDLGYIRGGHAVCIYGAYDGLQAVKIKNSWGKDYPLVFMPYKTLQRLLREDGEATLITDN
jgi:hypothetical protein